MKPTDFARHLTDFLSRYLPLERNVSAHTVRSYRDAFVLLLRYLRDERALPPHRVTLDAIDASTILEWLEYLKRTRECVQRTLNQRLAAMHSFFQYLQVEEPTRILQAQRVLAIKPARYERRPIVFLGEQEVGVLLAQPNISTKRGSRDAVLLSLLYDTGARSQEIRDLRVRDIRCEAPAHIKLTGKGRKTRYVPLMEPTVVLLRAYLSAHGLDQPEQASQPLFQGRPGYPLSRSGLRYLLQKYARAAKRNKPSLMISDQIGPHCMRHTKAMHLMEAGVYPIYIRDLLGHEDIKTTTEIYARASIEAKRRVLERVDSNIPPPPATFGAWRQDKDLMAWLRNL
jgi:integrase/recombinase XerD